MAAHCLCKILYVLYMTPLLCSNSQQGKVCLACALETGDSHNMPFWRGTALRAAYLARQALCRGIAC